MTKLKDERVKISDQFEVAGMFCLLQPCMVRADEATGGCYACKIGSSIMAAYKHKENKHKGGTKC